MKIVFAGTPEFAAQALQFLLNQSEHQVVAVYTQPDRPAGRGQKLTVSPVKQLALAHGITVYQPLHFKQSTPEGVEAIEQLKQIDFDVMVVAAYGLLLPQAVLDIPRLGCLNVHASILPRWRGAAPIHRAILAGDAQTGITIMQMNAGLDTGNMLYVVSTPILPKDTSQTLHDKLADMGGEAIVYALNNLSQLQAQATVQDENLVTYAHKLSKAEGQIDWQQNALTIQRQVLGLNPWPVAYCQLKDATLRIWQAEKVDLSLDLLLNTTAGTVLAVSKHGVDVACGQQTAIRLTQIQWSGGKPLNAVQVLQAQKIAVGDVLQ